MPATSWYRSGGLTAGWLLVALVTVPAVSAAATAAPPPSRFSRLLRPAVHDGVLSQAEADRLEVEGSALRIGELPPEVGLEEGLARVAQQRGWLAPATAEALVQRTRHAGGDDRSIAPPGEAISWLTRLVGLLPWIGGLAIAGGGLALLVIRLARSKRLVQIGATAAATGLLLEGARRLGAASWSTASEVLALAGAVCLLGTVALVVDWRKRDPFERGVVLAMAIAWSAIACALGSSGVATLAAIACGYGIGAEAGVVLVGLNGKKAKGPTLVLIGGGLIGLGYAALIIAHHTTPALTTLVRPFWSMGLVGLMAAVGVSWDWRTWLSPSRLWTLLLGLVCIGWGIPASEGVFVGAGGLALVAWAYVILWATSSGVLSVSARVLLTGLLTLGLAAGLDRHWAEVVGLLTLRSF